MLRVPKGSALSKSKPATTLQLMIQLLSIPILINIILKYLLSKQFVVHGTGIIVISGASSGIGRHAAEYLASKGYEVYAGVRKASDVDAIIAQNSPHLQPILLDVTSHESCVKAMEHIKAEMVRSNLPMVALINNAGLTRYVPLEFHKIDDIRTVFETNVFGLLDLTQTFLPLIRESKGRIVLISSIAGKIAPLMSGIYAASKHSVEAIGDALRRELLDFGISVSIVEPGYVKTPIFDKTRNDVRSTSIVSDEGLAQLDDFYGKYYADKHRNAELKKLTRASEPTVTSEAIFDAVVNSKPHTRYAVANANGIPSWIVFLLPRFLPDRVVDALVASN